MRFLRRFEDWIVILSFLTIVLVTFINVLSRYIFQSSLAFTEEITINLLVVLTMMGAVVALRTGSHLGFEYLVEISRGTVRTVLVVVGAAVIIGFLLVLLVYGSEMLINQAGRGRSTPSLDIPQWLFTLVMPLSGLLGIFHAVEAARRTLREASAGAIAEVPGSVEDPTDSGSAAPRGAAPVDGAGRTDGGDAR